MSASKQQSQIVATEGPPPVPWWGVLPVMVGSGFMGLSRAALHVWSILFRTLYYIVRGRVVWKDTMVQAFEFGWRSIFFVTVTMGFVAMLFVYMSAYQVNQVTGDLQLVGATYIELVIKDLYPSIGAAILATRLGAGMAAEIGSMVVTDQVDAVRMCGSDPVEYLVVRRFVASIVAGTSLLIYSGGVLILVGMFTVYRYFDVNPRIFWNLSMVQWHEVGLGIVKSLAYTAAIPIVSCYCGLSTFGGSKGVGWATTRAVVNSTFAIIMLDALISIIHYFMFY
ncbi:MAG: ABC transporter permease [Pseudomonadota bacterium]